MATISLGFDDDLDTRQIERAVANIDRYQACHVEGHLQSPSTGLDGFLIAISQGSWNASRPLSRIE
jgi:hypothetical protein